MAEVRALAASSRQSRASARRVRTVGDNRGPAGPSNRGVMLPPPWSQAAPGSLAGGATFADPTDSSAGRPDEELPLSPSVPT
ncbi:hypothetical protein GCM10014719_03820 [Planomonospora parontospora subsp. antibiotica]|nr:hypothetical protein GCM10014719_03820 [Planomonospora parontospora subsp. antibiotica]GII13541.1 hypothetical protein Ppa05_02670 [Planomonospora parontospora subsp. antibiotica]